MPTADQTDQTRTPRQPTRQSTRRRRTLAAGGALALVLGAAGVASAAVPDSTTRTISACYATSGGALRVIDPSTGAKCKATEKPLAWRSNGMVWRGPWAAGTAYKVGDTVTADGSTFVATATSTGAAPTAGSPSWATLAGSAPVPAAPKLYFGQNVQSQLIDPDLSPLTVATTNPLPDGQYLVTGKVWLSNPDPQQSTRTFCWLGPSPWDQTFVNLAPGENDTLVVSAVWTANTFARSAELTCRNDGDPARQPTRQPTRLNWATVSALPVGAVDSHVVGLG